MTELPILQIQVVVKHPDGYTITLDGKGILTRKSIDSEPIPFLWDNPIRIQRLSMVHTLEIQWCADEEGKFYTPRVVNPDGSPCTVDQLR